MTREERLRRLCEQLIIAEAELVIMCEKMRADNEAWRDQVWMKTYGPDREI